MFEKSRKYGTIAVFRKDDVWVVTIKEVVETMDHTHRVIRRHLDLLGARFKQQSVAAKPKSMTGGKR